MFFYLFLDVVSFLFRLKDMIANQEQSVFTERTDAASAEQYFQVFVNAS